LQQVYYPYTVADSKCHIWMIWIREKTLELLTLCPQYNVVKGRKCHEEQRALGQGMRAEIQRKERAEKANIDCYSLPLKTS